LPNILHPEPKLIAVPVHHTGRSRFYDAYGNALPYGEMFGVTEKMREVWGRVRSVGICRQNGARRIVITDVNDYRLDLAMKWEQGRRQSKIKR
jgi:hypothetical protein